MATPKKMTDAKGNTYYLLQVSRGHDKAPYRKRWYPPKGVAASTVQRELKKAAAEFVRAAGAGEIITRAEKKELKKAAALEAARVQTLEQFANGVFLPIKENSVSRNTYLFYRNAINNHILPRLGACKVPEISSAMITKLLQDAQANTGLSNRSVIAIFQTLTQIFQIAFDMDVTERNPMIKVRRPRSKKDEERNTVEAFSAEEVKYILQCLDAEPLKWKTYLCTLIYTGLRRGEACGLQWADVDFDKQEIKIRRTICYDPERKIYENSTKTGRTRTVPAPPVVFSLMRQLRGEQAESCMSKWVFSQDGASEVMHPQSPDKWLRQFGQKNGIEHLHPHKLRHSFATLGIINGADVTSMASLLGHADASTTLRVYAHADDESRRRAAQTFLDAIAK